MSSDYDPQEVVRRIIASIQEKQLILFCGAGISFDSGLPLAWPLMDRILVALGSTQKEIERIRYAPIPFEAFIGILQRYYSIDSLLSIFEEGLPNTNHHLIANLMVSGQLQIVVTTNFDKLIESALSLKGWVEGRDYHLFYHEQDFSTIDWNDGRPKLIKIHGSIHDRERIAITMRHVAGKQLSAMRQRITDHIFGSGHSVLILGYSLSDVFDLVPFIRALEQPRAHVVIVQHSENRDNPGGVETLPSISDPFARFTDSFRLTYDTNQLVRQIRDAALPHYPNDVVDPVENLWGKYLDAWRYGISRSDSEDALNLMIGHILVEIQEAELASRRFKYALVGSRAKGHPEREICALMFYGALTESIRDLEEALKKARQAGLFQLEAHCLYFLAYRYCYDYHGDFDKAAQACGQGLAAARTAKDVQLEGMLLSTCGNIYRKQKLYDKAINQYEEALEFSREVGDKELEGEVLFNKGLCYERSGQTGEGHACKKESVDILQSYFGKNHPRVKDFTNPEYNPE